MTTLGDAFPQQQERCRDLITMYRSLGPAGHFGARMIEQVLADADRAAIAQDLVAMIRSYKAMEECQ